METMTEFTTAGIAFLLTLALGFWLSNSGKPYNGILFNAHKLIALGAVILTAVPLFTRWNVIGVQVVPILSIVIAAVCVIALFTTGARMSMEKLSDQVTRTIHRLALILTVAAMFTAIYLLNTARQ